MNEISSAAIMFANLIDSRSKASLIDYAEMVREFKQLSIEAVKIARDRWGVGETDLLPRIMADEISVCIFGSDDSTNAVLAAMMAFELKLRWYTSKFISRTLEQSRRLIDLSIGICLGKVTADGYSLDLARAKQLAEYAMNNNISLVQCDRNMYNLLLEHPDIIAFFSDAQRVLLDGQPETTYELIDCKHSRFAEYQLQDSERLQVLKCAELNPSALWIYSSLSYRDYKSGKYDIANSMAQDILSKSDNRMYLPAQVLIAQCKFRQNDFRGVVEELETVQEKTHPLIASYLAVAARNLGQFYKAKRVLEASLTRYPKNPYILNAVAFTVAKGHISIAIDHWLEEFSHSPTFPRHLHKELRDLGYLPDSESRDHLAKITISDTSTIAEKAFAEAIKEFKVAKDSCRFLTLTTEALITALKDNTQKSVELLDEVTVIASSQEKLIDEKQFRCFESFYLKGLVRLYAATKKKGQRCNELLSDAYIAFKMCDQQKGYWSTWIENLLSLLNWHLGPQGPTPKSASLDTIASYNIIAESFSKKWGEDMTGEVRDALKIFRTHLNCDNPKVLDIGCGPGRDTNELASLGCKIVGVDASKAMLKIAKRKHKHLEFQLGNILELDIDKQSLDGVWCNGVLMHLTVEQARTSLAMIFDSLKDEGTLFLSAQIGKKSGYTLKSEPYNCSRFFQYYTWKDLKTLVEDTGFQIVKTDPTLLAKVDDKWVRLFLRKIPYNSGREC